MNSIKLQTLNNQLNEYQKDAKHTVLRHALVNNSLKNVATSQDEIKIMISISLSTLKLYPSLIKSNRDVVGSLLPPIS